MATLKISDLSVGDWVSFEDVYFKVGYIFPDGIIGITCRNYRDGYEAPLTNLHPIPITAETLEKNGFECIEEDVDTALYGTPSCSIFHTKGTLRYRLDTPQASVVCWFVHELQHVLRLAGVDEEINL